MSPGEGGSSRSFLRGLLAGTIAVLLAVTLIPPLREALLERSSDSAVDDALGVIEDSYFRPTDTTELENASVEGMVRRLRRENDDRFSHYFDPETYSRFLTSTNGQFSGIGLTVSEVKQGLRVARVFPGTPAEGAGIVAGDLITAVEGKSIAGVPSEVSAARIKGPPGTEVEITVEDPKSGKSRDLTVARAEIQVPVVAGRLLSRDGARIGYVSLATFSRGAHGELRSKIEDLIDRGAEGLVLDLRGNGGGLVDEAVLVTSIFLEDGPVLTTEGRSRPRQTFDAQGDALPPRPLVVLTNRDTASASEIVTAALKENDLATVVGTRTYGKGTFQEVIELDDGSALDLTVGEYLTADGSSILGVGVRPDVRVKQAVPAAGEDRALDRGAAIVVREINPPG